MLIRALIVLLAVLNLGVAAWWLGSKPPAPHAVAPLPAQTPPLQLAGEPAAPSMDAVLAAPASVAAATSVQARLPASNATAVAPSESAKPVVPPQCLRFGPFANKDEAGGVLARLGALAGKSRIVDAQARQAKAWRVLVPPQADAASAEALAQKIAAAGFSDNFVMHGGENANAIALGVYRNRDGAEKRLGELQKAGFPVQLAAVGEEAPTPQWWADAALAADASAATARQRGNAPAKTLDCAGLR